MTGGDRLDDVIESLCGLDIPTCLRICAGTDGSVTHLLELMTGQVVRVKTLQQQVIEASDEIAGLLGISAGDAVNERTVLLCAGDVVYVYARSLVPINRMPAGMEGDLTRADIPIGRILKKYAIESRREIDAVEVFDSQVFGEECMVLSRTYRIIHDTMALMWINEMFPTDSRWNL